MTGRVAHIWRHPIKGHGREPLDHVTLSAGQTIPWDRRWAVAHDAAKADGTEWAPCQNFSRGARTPSIMAIAASVDEAAGTVTLTHPERPPLTFDPDREEAAFLTWVRPLMDPGRAMPARILRVPGRGMTDTDFPSISLGNLSSLRALSDRAGRPVAMERFRINLWLEGLGPWEEFEWIGRRLRLGQAILQVEERITRCLATHADPRTGTRDIDVLGTLTAGWDHTDFGIYATVVEGGDIHPDDPAELLP